MTTPKHESRPLAQDGATPPPYHADVAEGAEDAPPEIRLQSKKPGPRSRGEKHTMLVAFYEGQYQRINDAAAVAEISNTEYVRLVMDAHFERLDHPDGQHIPPRAPRPWEPGWKLAVARYKQKSQGAYRRTPRDKSANRQKKGGKRT